MPPLSFMILVMFQARFKSGGSHYFWLINSLRFILRYRDGKIYGRPLLSGQRPHLETWEDGKVVWVSPDYDAYMAEAQQRIDKARAALGITQEYDGLK